MEKILKVKTQKIFLKFLCCILLILTTSCTVNIPNASPNLDAELKLFIAPKENLAGVYIYRLHTFGGAHHITNVFANGKLVGANWNSRYIYIELPQGEHKITAHNEMYKRYTNLDIQVEAGKLYFIQDHFNVGNTIFEIDLFLVDEETGKENVLKTTLAPLF